MKEYIEREAFIDAKRKQYCGDCDRRKGMKNGKVRFCYDIGEAPCRACSVDDMLNDVEDFPAADVVGVRHGEWKKVHDEVCYWLACSVCGEEIPKRFGTDYYTNYCPNCGAKMDGGADDAAD